MYSIDKKVIVLTPVLDLSANMCYSFNYNLLFQATKFSNVENRKAPVIVQVPHLRANPSLGFDLVHRAIFALQSIALAQSLEGQEAQKMVNGRPLKKHTFTEA